MEVIAQFLTDRGVTDFGLTVAILVMIIAERILAGIRQKR
jgi:hypothetical protein